LWTVSGVQISVIVPAFNEEKYLEGCLESIEGALSAFRERGWETEVIVCDNNSSDQTPLIASNMGARVVFEPVNQIARARNAGAAVARGDWLVFVDADSQPGPGLFREVADEIRGGRCLAGGATVRFDEGRLWLPGMVAFWNGISRLCRWMAGSFIFCDAAVFREVGGFNEELYVSEEIELSRRLKRLARERGRRVVILHRHPLVTSARKLRLYTFRQAFWVTLRFVFRPLRSPKDRRACYMWYEGRR